MDDSSADEARAEDEIVEWVGNHSTVPKRFGFMGDILALGDLLGAGADASVFEIVNIDRPGLAAKVFHLPSLGAERDRAYQEAQIWASLRHENIITFWGVAQEDAWLFFVLERAQGGEVFEFVQSADSLFSATVATWMRQLCAAVVYLHGLGIIHRDLKPENLLLDSPAATARLRLTDFGYAKLIGAGGARTPCGTVGYMAPEQQTCYLRGQAACAYGRAADMWSVGVVTYVLLIGTLPFESPTGVIDRRPQLDMFGALSKVPPEAVGFVSALLQLEPGGRLSAVDALAHPWLSGDPSSAVLHPHVPLVTPLKLRELRLRTPEFLARWTDAQRLSACLVVRQPWSPRRASPLSAPPFKGLAPMAPAAAAAATAAAAAAAAAPAAATAAVTPAMAVAQSSAMNAERFGRSGVAHALPREEGGSAKGKRPLALQRRSGAPSFATLPKPVADKRPR